MLLALALHTGEAILIQLYSRYAYDLEAVEKGDLSKISPEFFPNSKKAFVAIGTSVNLTIVGVLIVKLNFLLFFRRLGTNIPKFIIAWWAILIFTVAGAMAQIGMQEFGCFFGDITYIFSDHCTDAAALKRIFFNAIFSATADALSDMLIIGLPVAILWKSRISNRKKLILTFIFCLVFLTIAITIVRGSVFHQVYNSATSTGKGQMQSATFTWFWFYCEFSVACIVSFRTLFVQRGNQVVDRVQEQRIREAAYKSAMRRGLRARARQLHDSVLETCKTLEGWSGSNAESLKMRGLPGVPTGLMTVDFGDDANWRKAVTMDDTSYTNISGERSESVQSVPDTLDATHAPGTAR
ncbi:putative Integral membrane protein [Seiridium unicorne]|uniref:Integral membrane protein n=1 Tax=Seiridium unicorne TaxID=138068 RepID=A0ABR2VED1_9PEZI